MDFGFTLKPENDLGRTVELTKRAEANGFTYGWLFDSHVLWREPYVLLTLMAQATTKMRLGTCVTNPATREPSVTASALAVLDELSGGRMNLGIGRGDSARRVLGKPPTTMKTLEEAIAVIRDLVEGRAVTFEGTELVLPWTGKWKLPVWVAPNEYESSSMCFANILSSVSPSIPSIFKNASNCDMVFLLQPFILFFPESVVRTLSVCDCCDQPALLPLR